MFDEVVMERPRSPERFRYRGLVVAVVMLAALLVASEGFAQVSVDRVILSFDAGKPPVTNLNVRNSSNSVLYVKTETLAVENAGERGEKHVPTDRLLISPKHFSIPANGQRTVRLLLREAPGSVEKTYRASFMPVETEAGFEQSIKAQENKKAILRVLTGMGILVFLNPINTSPSLTWERVDQKVRITNSGNINIFVDQWRVCAENGGACRDIPPKRFYPGNTVELDVPVKDTVSFRKLVRNEFSNVVIPPKDSDGPPLSINPLTESR